MVAARLERPLSDDGLEGHFRALVSAGDRLAAVHLVMPYGWAYHLQRDTTGRVSASIAARDLGHQEVVESDDEGVALLAALALALQSGPTAAVLAWR